MRIRTIVGVNWGDEGKGRMVDYFAQDADYVIRFQGGNNAGHTVVNEFGEFKLHLIPSGIFNKKVVNVLGPGTVINLEALADEIKKLKEQGIDITEHNLKISNRAIISFPFHKLQDEYEEERLGKAGFGSTKQGIAQIYSDQYLKYAVQIGALQDREFLKGEITRCLELKNRLFESVYHKPGVTAEAMLQWALTYGEMLEKHICDTLVLSEEAKQKNQTVLFEAQLGSLRDVHYGIYPFTTSSCTLAGFSGIGSGFFSQEKPEVIGVMKAFSTCVGAGPFVTEIKDELAAKIREVAHEYGALTGRPRRIGHLDAVASRFGCQVQNADVVALTKLDSLSGLKTLKLCTHYRIGTKKVEHFPITPELVKSEPIYMEMPGWEEDITGVRDFSKLPKNARDYIIKIEELIQTKIKFVSVGPHRDALIVR